MAKGRLENNLKKLKFKRLGILGGSFDPPHLGHLKISSEAKKRYKLNKVIWAVTKQNPFKYNTRYDLKNRILLSKKLTKNKKFIEIICYENKIKSARTYKLLVYLKKKYANFELYFIMGADNLINFHKWYKWKEISKICNIIVFDRLGYKSKSLKSISFKKLNNKVLDYVIFKKVNISSSKLRKI